MSERDGPSGLSAATLLGVTWIQYGNTHMRMRLGFFTFVLHLLFSLHLHPLPCVVDHTCVSFAPISDNDNERQRGLSAPREEPKVERKSVAMDITSLTKLLALARPVSCEMRRRRF